MQNEIYLIYHIVSYLKDESSDNTPFAYERHYKTQLEKKKTNHTYRVFKKVERKASNFPLAMEHSTGNGKQISVWCSNDYLGMSWHPEVQKAVVWVSDIMWCVLPWLPWHELAPRGAESRGVSVRHYVVCVTMTTWTWTGTPRCRKPWCECQTLCGVCCHDYLDMSWHPEVQKAVLGISSSYSGYWRLFKWPFYSAASLGCLFLIKEQRDNLTN